MKQYLLQVGLLLCFQVNTIPNILRYVCLYTRCFRLSFALIDTDPRVLGTVSHAVSKAPVLYINLPRQDTNEKGRAENKHCHAEFESSFVNAVQSEES